MDDLIAAVYAAAAALTDDDDTVLLLAPQIEYGEAFLGGASRGPVRRATWRAAVHRVPRDGSPAGDRLDTCVADTPVTALRGLLAKMLATLDERAERTVRARALAARCGDGAT